MKTLLTLLLFTLKINLFAQIENLSPELKAIIEFYKNEYSIDTNSIKTISPKTIKFYSVAIHNNDSTFVQEIQSVNTFTLKATKIDGDRYCRIIVEEWVFDNPEKANSFANQLKNKEYLKYMKAPKTLFISKNKIYFVRTQAECFRDKLNIFNKKYKSLFDEKHTIIYR